MAGRYVPPHMRNKDFNSVSTAAPARKPEDGYTLKEICHQLDIPLNEAGTLNALPVSSTAPLINTSITSQDSNEETHLANAVDNPDQLGFIVVFKHQHPDWPPSILCKSNLHLLPRSTALSSTAKDSDSTDGADRDEPSPTAASGKVDHTVTPSLALTTPAVSRLPPIPVFIQDDRPPNPSGAPSPTITPSLSARPLIPRAALKGKHASRRYSDNNKHLPFFYAGHYAIKHVTYIPPRSRTLIKLLEKKFSHSQSNSHKDSTKSTQSTSHPPTTASTETVDSTDGVDDGGTRTSEKKKLRKAEDWIKSLNLEWALIELERDGGDGGTRGSDADASGTGATAQEDRNPMVPLKAPEESGKGVTEILKGLRMKDGDRKE